MPGYATVVRKNRFQEPLCHSDNGLKDLADAKLSMQVAKSVLILNLLHHIFSIFLIHVLSQYYARKGFFLDYLLLSSIIATNNLGTLYGSYI